MSKLIDLESYPVQPVLGRLLKDKTTKENIIFATDAYADLGPECSANDQITKEIITGSKSLIRIQPRVEKAAAEQQDRTKKRAEVFTPSWIVNKMNNHCDEEWFGTANVFNIENANSWIVNPDPIPFDSKDAWKTYVDSTRLEITCGEAPYIVSRYDAATGESIPVDERMGMLDRKRRVVNEKATDDAEWLKWAERALQSCYGYEYQGDNLLIARINVLLTMVEHYERRFQTAPDLRTLRNYTNIICWNFWQMNGISGCVPGESGQVCILFNWRARRPFTYHDLKEGNK